MLYPSEKIYIDKSTIGGRGVFARSDIKKDEVVEVSPYIVLEKDDVEKGEVKNYRFSHNKGSQRIFALGYGGLFNHSQDPNLRYRYSSNGLDCLEYVAYRDIKQGEELFISYGENRRNSRKKD